MRISDWGSDVCSSDLVPLQVWGGGRRMRPGEGAEQARAESQRSGAGERVLNPHHSAAENVVHLAVERDWPVQPEDHPHLEMILQVRADALGIVDHFEDRKSTRLNSSH